MAFIEVQQLTERGPQRRADLHDGAFTADRPASSDARRRRRRLYYGDLRADAAAVAGDGDHDLGDTVAACFAGEPVTSGP